MGSFDDMWNNGGGTKSGGAAKSFDSMWDGGDDEGGGAAQAATTANMPKQAVDLTKFLTKPAVESAQQLMDMARMAGTAVQQTTSALSHGDVMGPMSALNRGAASGFLGMVDQAGNAAQAMMPAVNPLAYLAGHAVNPTVPQGMGLQKMFEDLQARGDQNIAKHGGIAGQYTTPQSDLNAIGEAGGFVGQAFAPGAAIAKGAGGFPLKLLEAMLTGEGYGVLGDVSQRYAEGRAQDPLASLYQGLGMALTGGALHTGIHATDRAGARMFGGKEAPVTEISPERDVIAKQIDELFNAPPRDGVREILDAYPPAPRDQAITADQLERNRASNLVDDSMQARPKDMLQEYDTQMKRDSVQRQIDDIFNQRQPESQSPETALKDIMRDYGVDPMQQAVRDAQDRMAPNPAADGTKNAPRGFREETRTPAEPQRPEAEPLGEPQHELPPMVQALLDAKEGISPSDRAYQQRVEASKKMPPPPEVPGAGKEQPIKPDTSAREALASGPLWSEVTVSDLAKHYPPTADRPGIKKLPDQTKLALVDKAGNIIRGKDGKQITASYQTVNDSIKHSGSISRLVDTLKSYGHQPINETSARLAEKKQQASPAVGVAGEAASRKAIEQTNELPPSKTETAPEVKPKAKGEFPRTGLEVPHHTKLEDRAYESWRPLNKEHKAIVDPIDAERRAARQAYIGHRFEEQAHDRPEASRARAEEARQDLKDNPDSKDAEYGGKSATSEKYRAQFAREFDTEFNKQLDENPGGIKQWLTDKQKFHSEAAQTGKEIRKAAQVKKNKAVTNAPDFGTKIKKAAQEFIKDESGGTRVGEWTLNHPKDWEIHDWYRAGVEGTKRAARHLADTFDGELTPQVFKRLFGMQTTSDAIRQYDPRFSGTRDKFLADLDQASVDVEDPRTQEGKDAWREVMKTGKPSDKLDANTNRYLQEFKRLSNDYVDKLLKPRIKELEDAGIKEGPLGKGRLLRMLNDDLKQLRGSHKDNEWMMRLLQQARGGYFRSIFLGNQEVAGLHAIEALSAGVSYDAGAMTQAMGLAIKALAAKAAGKYSVVHDFMNAYKTRGMETHMQDSEMSGPVKWGNKLNDAITSKIEKLPGGATAVDFMRAQLPEKMKIQAIRVAMAVRAAGELKYPGGTEGLMKDMLDQARHKQIPPGRQVLLDKARVQIYNDMNRLVMYSPLGFTEKTMFQRHGDFIKMMFPFTRSVVQQSRLLHSYGEDMIKAVVDAKANPLDLKMHAKLMQATARAGTMIGITALFAGAKAIPKEADDALRELDSQAYKDLHQALDGLHELALPGQRVEHLQPKLTPWSIAERSQGGIIESVKKITKDLSSDKKTTTQKLRAAVAAASFFQIDSVMGLIGSQKAYSLLTKLADGWKGQTIKYAYSEDGRMLGRAPFKTDMESEALDWFLPGVPDVVSKWIEQKQEADFRRHRK